MFLFQMPTKKMETVDACRVQEIYLSVKVQPSHTKTIRNCQGAIGLASMVLQVCLWDKLEFELT